MSSEETTARLETAGDSGQPDPTTIRASNLETASSLRQDDDADPFTTSTKQPSQPEPMTSTPKPTVTTSNLQNTEQAPATSSSEHLAKLGTQSQPAGLSRFMSMHFFGSIDVGSFESVNDIYMKYSIVAGPDWTIGAGSDVGVTQIARYKKDPASGLRKFVWNQPITIGYKSYNCFGWPQIVLSVYYFNTFGNDQILGYGCAHLPISRSLSHINQTQTTRGTRRQSVVIYAPQSTSTLRQILSWLVGKKPELVDSNLFARAECRSLLQMVQVGRVELSFNLTSQDVASNGYKS